MATKMTKQEAIEWVYDRDENEDIDQDDAAAAFTALYGREPNENDRREGLDYSAVVARRLRIAVRGQNRSSPAPADGP